MYDVRSLTTIAQCRTVMERARTEGNDAVYQDVFRRMCAISGHENDDPDDPIVRDFHEALAAYEQLLSEKNRRNQPAIRVRQKIRNKGIERSLIEWASGRAETTGFGLLVEAGLAGFTFESVVVRHPDRFPPDIVAKARARLDPYRIATR